MKISFMSQKHIQLISLLITIGTILGCGGNSLANADAEEIASDQQSEGPCSGHCFIQKNNTNTQKSSGRRKTGNWRHDCLPTENILSIRECGMPGRGCLGNYDGNSKDDPKCCYDCSSMAPSGWTPADAPFL